jgi:hypothetical protein
LQSCSASLLPLLSLLPMPLACVTCHACPRECL